MSERIATKAVLAAPLWLPEDTPTGIVYRCGYCSTIQPSSIYARERHTDLCPRPALAQEVTDHEADRARIEALEKALQDAYLNGFHAGRTATLAAEEKPVCDCGPGHICDVHGDREDR